MLGGDPSALTALRDKAIATHAAGNIAAAQALYLSLLETSPDDHVALHFLGVSYVQQGRPENGIPLIERALSLQPDYPDAHFNLGCALQASNRLDEAAACYRRALAVNPGHAGAQLNLGNALQALNRHAEAIACYQRTLELRPDDADAHNNWGNSLQALGRHEQAIDCYEKALALNPGHAQAHNNTGNSLLALNRRDAALACYERALALKPEYAEAENNLGHVLLELNRFDEALARFAKALAIKPDFAEAHNNWGMALQALNRHEEAIERYEHAIALKPDYAEAQWNKGLAALCLGRFEEGWPLYEKRWQLKNAVAMPDCNRPLWPGLVRDANAQRGSSAACQAGKSFGAFPYRRGLSRVQRFLRALLGRGVAARSTNLLLQYEQGFGDALQMLRYIPPLQRMGVHCWVQAPPALTALVQRSFPQARVLALGECPAEVEFRIPLTSLPLALKTFSEFDIPRAVPYLVVDERARMAWAARLAPRSGRKVGLAWRGRATHRNDRNRSVLLETLEPLFSLKDIQFIALQKDLTEAEQRRLACHDNVTAPDRELHSFDDTAALVSVLDLVISVDSAPAHLSGALGKATWLLLPFSPDWRWQLARSDCPWYPSARLFRQKSIGNWTQIVRELGEALRPSSLP
jgi:tetratricopeptide (TPR) repeat protein